MNRVNAVAARNQGRDIWGNKSFLNRAARFGHLADNHEIDIARHRVWREDGFPADRFSTIYWKYLDAIHRRTGSLRDAGHESRLRDVAIRLGDIHQPFGQDTTSLTANGEYGYGDRTFALLGHANSRIRPRAAGDDPPGPAASRLRAV